MGVPDVAAEEQPLKTFAHRVREWLPRSIEEIAQFSNAVIAELGIASEIRRDKSMNDNEPWLLSADDETQALWDAWVAAHDREVEARAVLAAVAYLASTPAVTIAGKGGAAELLRARASDIREGRK